MFYDKLLKQVSYFKEIVRGTIIANGYLIAVKITVIYYFYEKLYAR